MKRKEIMRCAERVRAAMQSAADPRLKRSILARCARCGACARLAPTPDQIAAADLRRRLMG